MVWAASGCTSVQNAELRVSVLVEAVSLGSLLVEILVVNVDICHPYLTVVMVFLRCPLVHLENLSLYCLNPIHHTEASPSCWHCFSCFWLAQFISHLVFAAFLTLGTRTDLNVLRLQGVVVWCVIQMHLGVLSWSCVSLATSQSTTSAHVASL